MIGLVEWADDKFNVRASGADTIGQRPTYKVDFLKQLTDRWSFGGQYAFTPEPVCSTPGPTEGLRRYEGMLGYRRGPVTWVASLSESLCATVRVKAHVNPALTVYTEATMDPREKKFKSTWMHRMAVTDGIEIKGDD